MLRMRIYVIGQKKKKKKKKILVCHKKGSVGRPETEIFFGLAKVHNLKTLVENIRQIVPATTMSKLLEVYMLYQ